MESGLLKDIVIIFSLAIAVLLICHNLKIPDIVGFMITGLIVGPHGLGLISSVEQVEMLAELGVIMLLFSIGIQFSIKELLDMKKTIFLGGTIQVLLSIFLTVLIARLFCIPCNQALFLGFLVSLSSTAIVLKQLEARAELASPHAKVDLGILIYQDIIAVPMMIIIPILASGGAAPLPGRNTLITAFFVIAFLILAYYMVNPLLYQIARTQSRELFLLCVIVICFSIAYLTHSAGLSLALGAFMAGLIISESEYSHQAMANILPFVDTFTSLFFISIGMLLDSRIILEHFPLIIAFTFLLISLKVVIAVLVTIILGYPLRTSVLVGFALCQVGEFSFILSLAGLDNNLISGELYQGFLSAAVFSMILTPFLMALAPRIAAILSKLSFPERIRSGSRAVDFKTEREESNHLIIVGYGVNGKNLARAASSAGIPFVILEINSDTVSKEKKRGLPIMYGDATQELLLVQAGIERARMLVIAIHDSAASRCITAVARRINPSLYILVRTRFVADVHDLHELGANQVIPEEYETSVEIFARVLANFMVPRDEIEAYIDIVRKEDYGMFRTISEAALDRDRSHKIDLSDFNLSTIRVNENSLIMAKKIEEMAVRKNYGVNILAIRRGEDVISNPGGGDRIEKGDYLILLGDREDINYAVKKLF